jgi:methanogenic corrinoid protein MtbC1
MVQPGAALANTALDLGALRSDYLAALLHGDRRAALALMVERGVRLGARVEDLHSAVIQECQREIGRLWQENVISIAQEHQATAISQLVLAHLYDLAPRAADNQKRVLVACVEGELHDFPARLVADALDLAGFEVRYLGANVPTRSLLALVRSQPVDLIALSVTMAFNVPAVREAVRELRAATQVRIAVGGGACLWEEGVAHSVGADLTACSARELVERAQSLLGVKA